jgi:integrase
VLVQIAMNSQTCQQTVQHGLSCIGHLLARAEQPIQLLMPKVRKTKDSDLPPSRTAANMPIKLARPRAEPLSMLVDTFTAAAQSTATQRSYASDVHHFKSYGGTIPASAEMVAEYLATFAGTSAVATLQHRLIAIHRAHIDQGLPSPVMDQLVKRTMQGIRRTFGTVQRQVKALVKDDLLEMMVLVDKQKTVKAARDKALLLIGFAGAFRRSELVALRCEDVTQYDNGIELLIRRSKTDQEGAGRTVFIPFAKGSRCPVKALKNWIDLAGIVDGPLFRPVNRHDKVVGGNALTPQSVALIVKASVRRMAGDDAAKAVAGHSLRAGYCTEAATVGLQPYQIREQTGHKSDITLARYIRPVAKRKIPSLL